MRLTTMAMAALLASTALPLAMLGGPAGAHTSDFPQPEHLDCDLHEGIQRYNGSLAIDDHYVQAGWWDGQKLGVQTDGTVPDTNEDGTSRGADNDWRCGGDGDQRNETTGVPRADGRDSPVWLQLKSTDAGENTEAFDVTITSEGPVVAALDVFEYEGPPDGASDRITPACPQGLVLPDIYPGDGESAGGYLVRLLHETADRHQRMSSLSTFSPPSSSGDLSNTIQVTLDPSQADNGYIIAIYPQVASTGDGSEDPKLNYSITADGTDMAIHDGFSAPTVPLTATHWVSPTGHLFDCVDDCCPLPSATGLQVPELPTPRVGDAAEELLDTALDEV